MRRYSLYKRGKYCYVQFKNPESGEYLPAKSTGMTDKTEALLVVSDWLKHGIPAKNEKRRSILTEFALNSILSHIKNNQFTLNDAQKIITVLKDKGLVESANLLGDGPDNEKIIPFLGRFWNYEVSPYVKEKLAYGHRIGKRHCYEQTRRIFHWEEFFNDEKIKNITREKLQSFQLYLKNKKLAPKSINIILSAGTVALKWAYENKIIKVDPGEGLRKFSGESRKRDILTETEVKKVFTNGIWKEERSRIGNLLSMTTGLRAGEVIALRREDIGKDRLFIRHSWSFKDGLKKPKNNEERTVPLLPFVKHQLLKLVKSNPHNANGFIFYHADPDRPSDHEFLRKGLLYALATMDGERNKSKINEEIKKWRERGICFHSWRHFYAAKVADKIDIRTLQLATGHKSEIMATHYANHASENHFDSLSRITTDIFEKIVK